MKKGAKNAKYLCIEQGSNLQSSDNQTDALDETSTGSHEDYVYRNSCNISRPWKIVVLKRESHLRGCGNLPDDATPIFISDSDSSLLGLSNDISFVSKFFLEGG